MGGEVCAWNDAGNRPCHMPVDCGLRSGTISLWAQDRGQGKSPPLGQGNGLVISQQDPAYTSAREPHAPGLEGCWHGLPESHHHQPRQQSLRTAFSSDMIANTVTVMWHVLGRRDKLSIHPTWARTTDERHDPRQIWHVPLKSLFWLLMVAWLTSRHLPYREAHYIVGNDSRFAVSFTGESSLPATVSCCYNLGEGPLKFVTFMNFQNLVNLFPVSYEPYTPIPGNTVQIQRKQLYHSCFDCL